MKANEALQAEKTELEKKLKDLEHQVFTTKVRIKKLDKAIKLIDSE